MQVEMSYHTAGMNTTKLECLISLADHASFEHEKAELVRALTIEVTRGKRVRAQK